MKIQLAHFHRKYVHDRRCNMLATAISSFIPNGASVLDVGCGDGLLMSMIQADRPDTHIAGVDILLREHTQLQVDLFDGEHLPYRDDTYDVVTFIDVLHHTENPNGLLKEARRVTRDWILIKDHLCESMFDYGLLYFMDLVGNRPHGVSIPANYISKLHWVELFNELHLDIDNWQETLQLYTKPADWLFGRKLHFIAMLKK